MHTQLSLLTNAALADIYEQTNNNGYDKPNIVPPNVEVTHRHRET